MTTVPERRPAFLPQATTRWSLIRRLKDGVDDDAWQEFYDTYSRLLHSLALRAGLSHEESDEAVQDIVTSVFRKLPDFEADPAAGSFKNWLFQLAQWRIRNQFHKRWRFEATRVHAFRAPLADDASRTPTEERIPDAGAQRLEAAWELEWQKAALDIALEKLKRRAQPAHFQIFYLHVVRGRPCAEVAEALGVSIAQVYLVKCRLLPVFKRLVRELEQRPL